MRGGLPLFSFKGIKVFLHWTFALLPAYIAIMGVSDGGSWHDILTEIGYVLIVFACVVLHEFGHALTAQRFGVRTRDITILPIGGVASLERMPEDPKQEFWITVAGPMVNLVIVGIAFIALATSGVDLLTTDLLNDLEGWTGLLTFLLAANLSLFLFNLIPAFPMDGGRILRSALGMWLPREKATRIATTIGRVLALCFVVYGLYSGAFTLAIIGVFIFMAAGSEARMVQQKANVLALRVGQCVRRDLIRMAPSATVQDAWNAMTLVDHHVVVVVDQGLYRGLVLKEDLRAALAQRSATAPIAHLTQHVPSVEPEQPAMVAYQRMVHEGHGAMVSTDQIHGLGVVLRLDLEKALGAIGPTAPAPR